jgi:SAM-dependent methyltransferase
MVRDAARPYLREREQAYFDQTVADIFGYYAIQVGLPEHPALAQCRIPSRWTLDYDPPAELVADPHALPFAENTIDLVVMPHALEFTDDPHLMLREAYRVMRPEGQIVIAGFNPFSLYGIKRYFGREQTPPWNGNFIGPVAAQGLAHAARLRRDRRAARRLRAAVRERALAQALRVLREGGRPLVADRRRRVLPARDQEGRRHARDRARLGAPRAPQEGARARRAREGRPDGASRHE